MPDFPRGITPSCFAVRIAREGLAGKDDDRRDARRWRIRHRPRWPCRQPRSGDLPKSGGGAPVIVLRGGDTAAKRDRHPEVGHDHFGGGKAAEGHDIGEAAEMADAKELAGDIAKALAG